MNGSSKTTIITVSVVICLIIISWVYYFRNYRQVELFETRKFNVFNDMELKILREELENPYLLWDTDGKRKLDFQPFSEWKLTIHNKVPKRLETGSLIYFPVSFQASYPMYYENRELETNYFPTKNSMIIATEPLEWISDEETKQIVIFGERLKKIITE